MHRHVLTSIISDPKLCTVFEEYLAKSYSWENFAFYFEVERFKQQDSEERRREHALDIYEKFLSPEAPFELGEINRMVRERIASNLDNPPVALFDRIQNVTFNNLAKSSVNDFLDDPLYISYRDGVLTKVRTPRRSTSLPDIFLRTFVPSCISF